MPSLNYTIQSAASPGQNHFGRTRLVLTQSIAGDADDLLGAHQDCSGSEIPAGLYLSLGVAAGVPAGVPLGVILDSNRETLSLTLPRFTGATLGQVTLRPFPSCGELGALLDGNALLSFHEALPFPGISSGAQHSDPGE